MGGGREGERRGGRGRGEEGGVVACGFYPLSSPVTPRCLLLVCCAALHFLWFGILFEVSLVVFLDDVPSGLSALSCFSGVLGFLVPSSVRRMHQRLGSNVCCAYCHVGALVSQRWLLSENKVVFC